MIDLLCPIKPHELSREDRRRWDDLVRRVSARAVAHGMGHDLLLLVYQAGFYHGVVAMQDEKQ
jgi:hypothetical protein